MPMQSIEMQGATQVTDHSRAISKRCEFKGMYPKGRMSASSSSSLDSLNGASSGHHGGMDLLPKLESALLLFDKLFFRVAPTRKYNADIHDASLEINLSTLSDAQRTAIAQLSGQFSAMHKHLHTQHLDQFQARLEPNAPQTSVKAPPTREMLVKGARLLQGYLVNELARCEDLEKQVHQLESDLVLANQDKEALKKKLERYKPADIRHQPVRRPVPQDSVEVPADPLKLIGQFLRKRFGEVHFFGLVANFTYPFYQVRHEACATACTDLRQIVYEDADFEDLAAQEVEDSIWKNAVPSYKRSACLKHAKKLCMLHDSLLGELAASASSSSSLSGAEIKQEVSSTSGTESNGLVGKGQTNLLQRYMGSADKAPPVLPKPMIPVVTAAPKPVAAPVSAVPKPITAPAPTAPKSFHVTAPPVPDPASTASAANNSLSLVRPNTSAVSSYASSICGTSTSVSSSGSPVAKKARTIMAAMPSAGQQSSGLDRSFASVVSSNIKVLYPAPSSSRASEPAKAAVPAHNGQRPYSSITSNGVVHQANGVHSNGVHINGIVPVSLPLEPKSDILTSASKATKKSKPSPMAISPDLISRPMGSPGSLSAEDRARSPRPVPAPVPVPTPARAVHPANRPVVAVVTAAAAVALVSRLPKTEEISISDDDDDSVLGGMIISSKRTQGGAGVIDLTQSDDEHVSKKRR